MGVAIFLDESTVSICRAHEPCNQKTREHSSCNIRVLVGVGACVIETDDDREIVSTRLTRVRDRIQARNGVATSQRMESFVARGWHATEDLPEFADPLLEEIDTDGNFKGHVRYVVLSGRPTEVATLYDHLFKMLLNQVLARYALGEQVNVVFERDLGRTEASYVGLVDPRLENVCVSTEVKGDNLLALADYLLYATMRYVARAEQVCPGDGCGVSHTAPIASEVGFDGQGAPQAVGHVAKDDRWHKLYFVFLRSMSSVVRLNPSSASR